MCYIAVCETRKLEADEISAHWTLNHHGAGVGWAHDGQCFIRKGFMSESKFIRWYLSANLPLPHIVHLRLATAGGIIPELTHPFPITSTSPPDLSWQGPAPILAFNGHWGRWGVALRDWPELEAGRKVGGPWSDARVLAALIGSWLEEESATPEGLPALLASAGKFVLLLPNGSAMTVGVFYTADGVLQTIPGKLEYLIFNPKP